MDANCNTSSHQTIEIHEDVSHENQIKCSKPMVLQCEAKYLECDVCYLRLHARNKNDASSAYASKRHVPQGFRY